MRENKDNEWTNSYSNACSFVSMLKDFDFIMPMVILYNCMEYTHSATSLLQGAHIDIIDGMRHIDTTRMSLQTARNPIDHYHDVWFKDAVSMLRKEKHLLLLQEVQQDNE